MPIWRLMLGTNVLLVAKEDGDSIEERLALAIPEHPPGAAARVTRSSVLLSLQQHGDRNRTQATTASVN